MTTHTATRRLKVAVDGRSLNRPHVRGIGRYLQRILSSEPARRVSWSVYGDRSDLPAWIGNSEHVTVTIRECRGDRFQAWEQAALPLSARLTSADVLFCPAGPAPMWQPLPTVITLHDVIPWTREDEGMQRGWYRDRVLPRAFAAAAAMMSPSQYSARAIADRWPPLATKLRVVPNGVDALFLAVEPGTLPTLLAVTGAQRPYVLYLGGEIARKRLTWAMDVWRASCPGGAHFVACGVNPEARPSLRDALPPECRGRVHFVDFVSDAELAALYANAALVLYPTLDEGFGLPAVEAQACGTPVLFSAVGSLAELAGPGAVVLPVDDMDAWVDACRTHLGQRAEHLVPNAVARTWASQFAWATTAAQVVDVLHTASERRWGVSRRERPS